MRTVRWIWAPVDKVEDTKFPELSKITTSVSRLEIHQKNEENLKEKCQKLSLIKIK